jgi:N-acetylglucosaminyldiphosphoundecaprenol N-acetyl-beta-D-mannosaminyltransferase
MSNIKYISTAIMVLIVAVICVFIQKFFKKYLERDQYYYLKDITLVGAWALFGIWAPDGPLRVTIAAAVVAACIGFCQKVTNGRNLRFMYFLVGLGFSIFGPRIAFIEFSNGGYYYLSYFASVLISTLWVGIFPIFFQEIDEVPGMCGLMLAVSWTLVSIVILSSSQNLEDASQVCITGIIFFIVFWSRHIHAYRRLSEPLTALWGTLFAGISIFGVSKGIAFYTLALIPLGLFALPIAETSLSVVSAVFMPQPTGNLILYRQFIKHGMDHASAVHTFVLICALCGCFVTCLSVRTPYIFLLVIITALFFLATWIFFRYLAANSEGHERNPMLWGVRVDNISLNYAITQVQHWINKENTPKIIVTPDALAALRSRTDAKYRHIVQNAGLVLPDGAGLITAFKLLRTPIQERLPGVEFVEHLCKRAAYEGWKVWFFGGKPGVAEKAAKVLKNSYGGLQIAGTCSGYFNESENEDICEKIRRSGAQILFVGLGVPKQEYWLSNNLSRTGALVGMGIGGSMDVIAGTLKRAPKVWQDFGMEWLYRTIQEPWRWRRILKLPVFVILVFLTIFRLDPYKGETK